VSATAVHDLAAIPSIDAEISALWLADVALAQELGWNAPLPLLVTVVAYPRYAAGPHGRRPRLEDRDWSNALAGGYALEAGEVIDLACVLSRPTQKFSTPRQGCAARVLRG
jgi:hypothetical protein